MHLILFVVLFVLSIIYIIFHKKKVNLPPGPPVYSIPIFGHLFYLGKHPQEILMKWCKDRQSDIIHCYFVCNIYYCRSD